MIRKRMQFEKAIVCLWGLFLFVSGIASAHDATRVFSDPPWVVHVDVEKDMLFIIRDAGLHAQRMDTGKGIWSLPFEKYDDCMFSRDTLIIEKTKGFRVLDKLTGKERWKVSEDPKGKPTQTKFIGSSEWVYTYFEDGGVVYTPEGLSLQPTISGGKTGKFGVAGWMPDKKTLLITMGEATEDSLKILTTYFWQPESDLIEKGYVLSSMDTPLLYYVSPGGKAVLYELNKNPGKDKYTVIDARSGVVERILEKLGSGSLFFIQDFALDRKVGMDCLTAVNLETGETLVNIPKRNGYVFYAYTTVLDVGKIWLLFRDEECRYWLWPLEEGATPRMIWESPSGIYSPGEIMAIRPPHILFDTNRNKMEAFLLEGMERVKTWRAEGPPRRHFIKYVCADLNRALAYYFKEDAENHENARVTQVFEAHLPEPIQEIPGSPRGISPDGRYCVVQHPANGPFHLVEIDSGRICAVVQAEKEIPYKVVFFSPNSRYMAVHVPNQVTVIHLENEYAQVVIEALKKDKNFLNQIMAYSVSFSPDGSFIVFQGLHGCAKVYSSSTGELVHIFEEPDMVTRRQESPPDGFLETAARFGKSLAGRFVTMDPETPKITAAFSADGKHLITLAEGQILRVWDIQSGDLVRTIRTGLAEKRDERGRINNHLVLSENGGRAFAYNSDGFDLAELWDISTGKLLRHYNLPDGKITEAIVADDGAAIYFKINDELYSLAGKKRS